MVKAYTAGQSFDPHHTTQDLKKYMNQFRAKYAEEF